MILCEFLQRAPPERRSENTFFVQPIFEKSACIFDMTTVMSFVIFRLSPLHGETSLATLQVHHKSLLFNQRRE